MNPENLSKLSEIALQYGPFFFAVLFVLGVLRWAYKVFKETNAKTNPPATPKELSTARLVFLGTFFFGLSLVVVSVVWWLGFRPKIYAFQGQIINLHDYETLAPASENLYFRAEPKDPIDGIPLRNEHFLIVRNSPLNKGEIFDVEFSKNKSTRNTFHIAYDPSQLDPKFSVDWDDTLHTNILRQEKAPKVQASRLIWTVHAAQGANPEYQVYQGKSPRSPIGQQPSSPVAVLQDSGSDVGSKIVALDELNRSPVTALTDSSVVGHEPILATLLDLTRHSDKEVSYKATLALKKVNLDDYVLQKLNSSQKRDQDDGQQVLLKMEPADSARILGKLSPTKAAALRAKTSQIGDSQVVPTASAQGDRYYVRATWDSKNTAALGCLTNLFHSELLSSANRSMDQERALMNRGQRLVYAFDKEWSIGIAEKIRNCGGTATFVQAGLKK
jgi:hypothetical protein